MENNSIEMEIAKTAAQNWGQEEPKNLEEAVGITWGSEVAAVKGMASVLGLNEEEVEKLVGGNDENGNPLRNGEIYTQDKLSEDISTKIKEAINQKGEGKSVISILSTIHNEWVKNNSKNFLKIDDKGNPRNKERQFVPLELLNWGEVESDLLFLKPILEGAGIKIKEQELKDLHDVKQKSYLINHRIFSKEALQQELAKGAKFYPALEGINGFDGVSIDESLKKPEVLERMSSQIDSKVKIKSREEMAIDIIKSENSVLDEMLWVETSRDGISETEYFPTLDGPITRKEIMTSKLIGKPYATTFLEKVIDYKRDTYTNNIRYPLDDEWNAVSMKEGYMRQRRMEAKDMETGKEGIIEKGIYVDMFEGPKKMEGQIEVSEKDMYASGLDLDKMGWQAKEIVKEKKSLFRKISLKDISEAGKEKNISTDEIENSKNVFQKIVDKIRGKEERKDIE